MLCEIYYATTDTLRHSFDNYMGEGALWGFI